MHKFYVYAYIRSKDSVIAKAGTPYYIGKGSGSRAFAKHNNSPVPSSKEHIVMIYDGISEDEAHRLEKDKILEYGRKDLGTGILHNKTDGGEGISNPSTETRAKMAFAKRNESSETREKRSVAAKNRPRRPITEETKRKISEAKKGSKHSIDTKEKMSKKAKGRPSPKLGKPVSAETREKIRQANLNRSPELLARIAEANRVAGERRIGKSTSLKGKPWSDARRAAQKIKEK